MIRAGRVTLIWIFLIRFPDITRQLCEADGHTFGHSAAISTGSAVPRTIVVLDGVPSDLAEGPVVQEAIDVALVDVPRADANVVSNFAIFDHGIDGVEHDVVSYGTDDSLNQLWRQLLQMLRQLLATNNLTVRPFSDVTSKIARLATDANDEVIGAAESLLV